MAGVGQPRLPLTQQPEVVAGVVGARPVPPQWMAAGVVGARQLLPVLAQAPLLLVVVVVAHQPYLPRPPAQVLQEQAVLVGARAQQLAASLLQAVQGLGLVPLSLLLQLVPLLQLVVHRQRACRSLLHSQLGL